MNGKIEVITGPMFAGKSLELIRRLRRAYIAKKKVAIFKHNKDDRYDNCCISTHNKEMASACPVIDVSSIRELLGEEDVVCIDEMQFFELDLADLANQLADDGVRVILAGINQDSNGQAFETSEKLLGIADEILLLTAVCVWCGEPATKTFKTTKETGKFVVGGLDSYISLCRKCFNNARSK